MDRTPEILAPAGGWESIMAAARCGADAVYLGARHFNARRSAQNFAREEMTEAVTYLHQRGVKAYLTLNTVVFEKEMAILASALETACSCGLDAIIVQDLAVAALARELAPTMPIHASTQMAVHSVDGAKQLEQLGFRRVVLAREMSLEEIRRVCEGTSLQVECFIHGALCMSVSGQCYLSCALGGRSGNRGMCAQPCRLPFATDRVPEEGEAGVTHALSLKDMSHLAYLGDMAGAGVQSFKIEGRMKRPEYVAAAVTACRQALEGRQPDLDTLRGVFSRSGFTDGYIQGKVDADMFGIRTKEDVDAVKPVLGRLSALYQKEQPLIDVDMALVLKENLPLSLAVHDHEGHMASATGEVPQEAQTAPTTREKAEQALRKTGGTFYNVDNLRMQLDDGLMVPVSALNALRREALDGLTEKRMQRPAHQYHHRPEAWETQPRLTERTREWRVRLGRAAQLSAALCEADVVIVPAEELAQGATPMLLSLGEKLWVEIPRIAFHSPEKFDRLLHKIKEMGVNHAVAGTLDAVGAARRHGFTVHGDYSLNALNTLSLDAYRTIDVQDMTVSIEADAVSIRHLGGAMSRGILVYGYLPLMAFRNCPIRAERGCEQCGRRFPELTDRTGTRFFLDCHWQVATLYNSVPLHLGDRLDEWRYVDFFTVYFTKESPEQCEEVWNGMQLGNRSTEAYTRGMYYRKVK